MNRKPSFVMMIGLPASGKSTLVQRLAQYGNFNIHSSDALRQELYGDEDIQDKNGQLFQELHKRIISDLKNGQDVILDATNVVRKRRIHLLNQLPDCKKTAIIMATPYNICLRQAKQRERKVPKEAIEKMYRSFQVPMYQEGFDVIDFRFHENFKDEIEVELFENLHIDQYNAHHTLSIRDHIFKACALLIINGEKDKPLLMAAKYHDIGKRFCMTFRNSKGEATWDAHFYSHENVSAYDSMFYLALENDLHPDDLWETVALINEHMKLHQTKIENLPKLFKFYGNDFYWKLNKLHDADQQAH